MNLGVFNRVNSKESEQGGGMYSEWASLSARVQGGGEASASVLGKFSSPAGKEVAIAVVRQLASNLGITQAVEPSTLTTDREVLWAMEVVCYGLSLPLTEHDAIRDCVNVYCEWLTALHPVPKLSVPRPITDDPNLYARKVIAHFHNLFVPRKGEGADMINRQAVLCHRVLRTLQLVAQLSTRIDRETWETLLLFLLAINDTLLAPPTVKDDVGDQLCERVVSVLLEVWLVACAGCHSFPSPPLWRTLREAAMTWRHRTALVEQWNRANLALTQRLLESMYGPGFPELKILDEDAQLVPAAMSNDCVAQAWFRLLHCIGNPVDLSRPHVISQTPKFLQFVITSPQSAVSDPSQHPCLAVLPINFLKAIKGIAGMVDAFLGIPKANLTGLTSSRISHPPPVSSTPTNSGPSSTTSVSSLVSVGVDCRSPLAPGRPKCNSILHLFGEWLFEAAQIGTDLHRTKNPAREEVEPGRYQSGRAEALGALCRIFSAKKTGEEILPQYYARFYLTLHQGLKISQARECEETLASILFNSGDLLRLDLDGVQLLVPYLLDALELVLPDRELILKSTSVSKAELRRASIHLLLSMLVLPLHFQNLQIRELFHGASRDGQERPPMLTFAQLKPRLMNLLINSLQVESDPQNTHMLLGGLLLSVLDSAALEEADRVTQPDTMSAGGSEASNLLSSVSDTLSSFSEGTLAELESCSMYFSQDDFFVPLYNALNKNSAHALFVRATYLVCHRLISSWKTDLNVSLAALELLSGLARTHIKETDSLECKRAVKWVCDYIVYQCWRPPPAHSKDLHSSIVAAFHCAATWLVAHPYLLQDKDTLHTVLEVVELGISGTKSQGKPGEPVKLKDEKELKPVSMRVRDAAEALLTVILEQVGYFPSPCGPESLSCLLDEVALLKHCNSWAGGGETTRAQACSKFRYFVLENSTLLALLEEPLGNDQDPQPTVTVLVRGGFGRHAWALQLRHLPRHRSGATGHPHHSPGRPVPAEEAATARPVRLTRPPRYFPESVGRIPQCNIDKSIPDLGEGEGELARLISKQSEEESGADGGTGRGDEGPVQECTPPPPSHDFQTARLFLTHFGFLSREHNKQEASVPPLVALDSTQTNFWRDLEALDNIGCRTCDTCHIFYVRSGQSQPEQILDNVMSETAVSAHFLEMLSSLGWPVRVSRHSGWTGHVATSWKLNSDADDDEGEQRTEKPEPHGGSLYNGAAQVLYWADVSAEIAFVVPTLVQPPHYKEASDPNENSVSGAGLWSSERGSVDIKPRTMSLDLDSISAQLRTEPAARRRADPPTPVLLVWLESFEDHFQFPSDELLSYTSTGQGGARSQDCFIIFLHALHSGLIRVKLQGAAGRMSMATPLVDGMLINRRVVGSLVRQTALNMCRRRRLDNDSYQPPHMRRRLKVQELVSKYHCDMSRSELLTFLLNTH